MSLFWLHNKRRRILSFSWNMCELCNLNPDIKTSKKHCTQFLEKNVKPNSFLSFGDLFWKLPAVQLKRTQQFSKMPSITQTLGKSFFLFHLDVTFIRRKVLERKMVEISTLPSAESANSGFSHWSCFSSQEMKPCFDILNLQLHTFSSGNIVARTRAKKNARK